jgi:predicted nuclease of predicted toxin-antitoxin system
MRFFLDENFPKSSVDYLNSLGYEAIDIRGTNQEGSSDNDLFFMAQKNQAIFLTTDRDFFHTIPQLFDHHHGVVVVALRQPNRGNILEKLGWFLTEFKETNFENRVFQLRDQTYLVFPPWSPVD